MAKKRNQRRPISGLQLEIMEIVWGRGEVTVGEVLEILAARRSIARNTVQTTLVRLEAKGWLRHRQVANAFRYSAVVERQETLGEIAGKLLDNVFGGSVESLVMALVHERGISRKEAQSIRRMIDESERKRG